MMSKAIYWRAVAILSCISLCSASNTGEFIAPAEGKEYDIREYTAVEIPWRYSYSKGIKSIFNIKWSYTSDNGKPVGIFSMSTDRMFSTPTTQFSGRLEFKGNLTKEDLTLAIKMFTKQDEGTFTCTVIGVNKFKRSVTIKVVVLANVTALEFSKDDVQQGDNVTLSCKVSQGTPSSEVQLLKDRDVINKTTTSSTNEVTLMYHFRSISPKENGLYTCRVTTDGYLSRNETRLRVMHPAKIINKSVKQQYGCLNETITLDCSADGDPKPAERFFGADGKSISRKTFQLKSFGVYRCEASNSLGNDSHNITISEAKERPKKPSFNSECSFKELTWNTLGSGAHFTLQAKEAGSSDWDDVITTLDTSYSPSTNESFSDRKTYEFRLIAENCVGTTVSTDECVVEGKAPSSGKRSSNNAGVIAGSVIAVLVVILIIVIVVVIFLKRKKRGSSGIRKSEESRPMSQEQKPKPAPRTGEKRGDLLYGDDSPNVDARSQSRSQLPDYSEIDHDDATASNYSNNVPSWV